MSSQTENNDTGPKVKKRARDNDDNNDNTLSSESAKEEGKQDRLSDLPDCVLIHLMTFMTTRDSVRTSVLSTRWKHLWKRVPSLMLDARDFYDKMTPLTKIVRHVLSLRDSSAPLHNLDLRYSSSLMPQQLLTRVVRYAVSHNTQCLKLHVCCYDTDFPPRLFSCQTLRSLDLAVGRGYQISRSVMWHPHVPKSLNLTALTSLRLQRWNFRCADEEKKLVEPFSSCVNLKTLVIDQCLMRCKSILCISNATLVNLTIHASTYYEEVDYKIMLSTPNLCCFTFSSFTSQPLTAGNLSRLEEVNIDVNESLGASHHSQSRSILFSWLQVFANARSLTVCSNTLKALSLIPDLMETKSPCLDNLESLTVNVSKYSPVPDGVVDYLIGSSPFAKVTIRNCQESKLGNSAKGKLVTAPRCVAEAEQRVEVRRSNRARQSSRRLEGYVQ